MIIKWTSSDIQVRKFFKQIAVRSNVILVILFCRVHISSSRQFIFELNWIEFLISVRQLLAAVGVDFQLESQILRLF